MEITAEPQVVAAFWQRVRAELPSLPAETPEAWAFGATPAQAEGLLDLVLAGIKTGTASSIWDYEADDEPLPQVGEYNVILDGSGQPRAVTRTTTLRVVSFDEVDEEHAHAEGEGDRSLAAWSEIHERFWRAHSTSVRGFNPNMPVLCERFELVYPSSG